jgi:cyclin-dependent kinase 12/13
MGCVFGRASPRTAGKKERASPKPAPTKGSPATASVGVDGKNSPGRPRRRLGRRMGPRQGCIPAPAAAEQLAAGWPPWLVAVAGEALRGWTPRRADTFEKLNKVSPFPKAAKFDVLL